MMELTQEEKMMLVAKQQLLMRKLLHDEGENKFYVVDAETGENRGSVVIDDYDPYTGKYAFCDEPSDEELEEAAQEAHDNLVRSLVEAGGEIRVLRELLTRTYEQLLLLGYDSGFTNDEIRKLVNDISEYFKENKHAN